MRDELAGYDLARESSYPLSTFPWQGRGYIKDEDNTALMHMTEFQRNNTRSRSGNGGYARQLQTKPSEERLNDHLNTRRGSSRASYYARVNLPVR